MSFVVRPAAPADKAHASDVLAASYGTLLAADYPEDVLTSALPLMTGAQDSLLESGTWYVAEDVKGTLLGVGGWTPERPGSGDLEPGLAHLRHFGTRPEATGRGVARAIIERSFRDGAAAGFTRWECYSTLTAVPFYARFGFVEVEQFDIPMSADVLFRSVRMKRDIADSR